MLIILTICTFLFLRFQLHNPIMVCGSGLSHVGFEREKTISGSRMDLWGQAVQLNLGVG